MAAYLRRAGGSMLENTESHGRGVEWRMPEMRCFTLTRNQRIMLYQKC